VDPRSGHARAGKHRYRLGDELDGGCSYSPSQAPSLRASSLTWRHRSEWTTSSEPLVSRAVEAGSSRAFSSWAQGRQWVREPRSCSHQQAVTRRARDSEKSFPSSARQPPKRCAKQRRTRECSSMAATTRRKARSRLHEAFNDTDTRQAPARRLEGRIIPLFRIEAAGHHFD
jgi:hypothetical protein